MNIGIVGLGLIGGSLAKAMKARTKHVAYGFDISQAVLDQALEAGAIAGVLDETALGDCDVVIVALYPKEAVEYVETQAPFIRRGAVVVDCCGVKRSVCAQLESIAAEHEFVFVGGHPMAGTEKWGFSASDANLFSGASMIITPTPTTPEWAIERIKGVFFAMGFGHLQCSSPEEHDFIISYTSQLAHVVSCAYIDTDSANHSFGFTAGSFRDMTRVAKLNETMWTELFLANADFLADEVDGLVARLNNYSKALRCQDRETIHELLKQSREQKERVDAAANGRSVVP